MRAEDGCATHASWLAGRRAALDYWTSRGGRPEDLALPLAEYRRRGGRPTVAASDEAFAVFVDVNVIPMDRERILRNQTVIVRGDRIETVGRSSRVAIPEDAVRVRGKGKYLIPGLVDMHVHTSYRAEHVFYVANGVTTVRDMWGSAGHLSFRDAVLAGEEFGAAMWVATPGFVGPNPVLDRAVVVTTPAAARKQVRRHARAGYDFVKVHERLEADPYEAVAGQALRSGIPVTGHVPAPTGIERVLAGGAQSSISHLHRVLPGPGTDFWDEAPTRAAMTRLARRLRAGGIATDPTLATLRYALDEGGVEAFRRRPELVYLPAWQVEAWIDSWTRFGPWRDPGNADRALTNLLKMVRILDRERAPLLLGTDGGFTFILPGFTIHEELELYVEAGLSPYRALRAATLAPAEFLGAANQFGAVAEGLRADLVLLNRNPLRKIRNTRRIDGVMLRGKWLPREELERRLAEVAASFE